MAHRIEEPKGPEGVTWVDVAMASELSGEDAAQMAGWINEKLQAAYRKGREDGAAEMPDLDGPEYNGLVEHLMYDGTRDGLLLAGMVKDRFGASARRRREA